jgi:hypothetical protein
VLRHWDGRTLPDLLAEHGLTDAPEAAFANDGWSGASLTRLVRPSDGAAFVLKRTSWAVDWIARSTRDHALREGFIAATPLPLPEPLVAPYLGAAADGTAVAMLMPDLSDNLLGWELGEGPADAAGIERILAAVARLHAAPWPIAAKPDPGYVWPTAPLAERLLLLAPRSAKRLAGDDVDAGHRFLEGWTAFDRRASPSAVELVRSLDADPGSLLAALGELPATGLHGDLKLSNVAPLADGRIALIDWQMTMLGPVAVELGWLLVGNSGVLPDRPEAVLDLYRQAVTALEGEAIQVGAPFDARRTYPPGALTAVLGEDEPARFRSAEATLGDWAAQVDLAWIVGLLLRGWRKGTDAEAGAVIGSGVTATDDLGWWCDQAVEAAGRRL